MSLVRNHITIGTIHLGITFVPLYRNHFIMKKYLLLPLTALCIIAFSACSKCYECEIVREYNNVPDTVIDDICTASGEEIKEREANGYNCKASTPF